MSRRRQRVQGYKWESFSFTSVAESRLERLRRRRLGELRGELHGEHEGELGFVEMSPRAARDSIMRAVAPGVVARSHAPPAAGAGAGAAGRGLGTATARIGPVFLPFVGECIGRGLATAAPSPWRTGVTSVGATGDALLNCVLVKAQVEQGQLSVEQQFARW